MTNADTPFAKVLLCVTEDWFVLSHFKPLVRALRQIGREVVVATRDGGRLQEVAALGVRTIDFDYSRKSTDPRAVYATAKHLRALISREHPDVVHFVALKPIVLGGLALQGERDRAVAVHLTGLGLLGVTTSLKGRLMRGGALSLASALLRRPRAHFFVENEDDLARVTRGPATAYTVLGGAGVDPTAFEALPFPAGPPTVACVGRMIRSKGVDVLVEAARRLRATGTPLTVHLYGGIDAANPEAYTAADIEAWQREGLVTWHGHADDVRRVWRDASICVLPSRGGEGLPRVALEAAACARPLIVTDVPGCRRFVRDGIEGRVVPPDDADALVRALGELAASAEVRHRMGHAARQRVLDGFTEQHAEAAFVEAYHSLATRSFHSAARAPVRG